MNYQTILMKFQGLFHEVVDGECHLFWLKNDTFYPGSNSPPQEKLISKWG